MKSMMSFLRSITTALAYAQLMKWANRTTAVAANATTGAPTRGFGPQFTRTTCRGMTAKVLQLFSSLEFPRLLLAIARRHGKSSRGSESPEHHPQNRH